MYFEIPPDKPPEESFINAHTRLFRKSCIILFWAGLLLTLIMKIREFFL